MNPILRITILCREGAVLGQARDFVDRLTRQAPMFQPSTARFEVAYSGRLSEPEALVSVQLSLMIISDSSKPDLVVMCDGLIDDVRAYAMIQSWSVVHGVDDENQQVVG